MRTLLRKSLSTTVLCLLPGFTATHAQWSEPSAEQIIVRGGWQFDGVSDTRRRNTGIVIRDGVFAEIDAVLKAATINGAHALGVADRLSSIEVVKLADLYVAKGNPLDDIKTARNVQVVIKSDVICDPESLLRSAEGKMGPVGPDDHADWELHIKPLRVAPDTANDQSHSVSEGSNVPP